ncbi:DUF1571 domain-containing protein [Aureispira anguillae]|uniref:DUF1571 domain-containing protein n=1 Tax=Aureispira anguillae TaxID=2864201 RepID=A0A915YEM8_9BACT|nr:DUF1571 domain-containing protein [Aureispira anguillae]BDS11713.1 DUF1571 domain-containing protein [Aureispira anguillae]
MKSFSSILLLSFCSIVSVSAQDAVTIIGKMRTAISKINKSSFELHSKERFGDKYVYKKMKFHMQESPKKVYMKDLEKGVELLYVVGWNNNKGYINPNGFPWINVSLSVYDSKVVAENHHTVDDAGLGFVNTLLNGFESTVEKAGKEKSSLYTYKGDVTYEGRSCYKIYIVPPTEFKYISYTTKRDQNLMQLSRRIVASDFLMKEKNRLSYTRTIKKGTTLTVPNAYAKKVIVYIDKKTYMPVVQMLYDEKGLFEKYEYKNISLYPKFASNEFTTDCASYGF